MKILLENPDLSEQYIVNMYVIFHYTFKLRAFNMRLTFWAVAFSLAYSCQVYGLWARLVSRRLAIEWPTRSNYKQIC